jgi:hypothetical protein
LDINLKEIQAQVVEYMSIHGTAVISDDHKGDASLHKSRIISIVLSCKEIEQNFQSI